MHYILLPYRVHDISWSILGFLMTLYKGFLLLRNPTPPYAWSLPTLQDQLNICSSARLAVPTTLVSRLNSSSWSSPVAHTIPLKPGCSWPDNIFRFVGLNGSVPITQLSVASKAATDNTYVMFVAEFQKKLYLQKQVPGRFSPGAIVCQPLL